MAFKRCRFYRWVRLSEIFRRRRRLGAFSISVLAGADRGLSAGEAHIDPGGAARATDERRITQVGHGRRLNSCFCRKAFKEIGRDWGRHTNTTDDDDDNAVVAVEAPTPAKKKALPAFALDFGNGA